MTTYVPRAFVPAVAVRLKEDLIVPSGDWVLIDADDVVRQMTDAQFRSIYREPPKPKRSPGHSEKRERRTFDQPKPIEVVDGMKPPSRTEDGLVRTAGGRVLYALRLLGGSATVDAVAAVVPRDADSVSGRLSELKYFGLVSHQPGTHGKAVPWTVTDRGDVVLARVGTSMFTDHGREVPALGDHV